MLKQQKVNPFQVIYISWNGLILLDISLTSGDIFSLRVDILKYLPITFIYRPKLRITRAISLIIYIYSTLLRGIINLSHH